MDNNTDIIDKKENGQSIEKIIDLNSPKKKEAIENPSYKNLIQTEFLIKEILKCPAKEQKNEPPKFIEVEFKGLRKSIFQNPKKLKPHLHSLVIVDAENGHEIGKVCSCGLSAEKKIKLYYSGKEPEYKVDRVASESDINKYQILQDEEGKAMAKSRELVEKFKLDMKITDAEWQFDRQRLTIYFTAPQRIDFRELVKELARTFKTRIELRQISSREETKRLGDGIGPCGRELCCTYMLHDFNHVTLDHARHQQLSNNVAKLSGYCGRLKCCLLYEFDTYVEAYKEFPPLKSKVLTKEGEGKIIKIDVFKKNATVFVKNISKFKTIEMDELKQYMKDNKVLPPDDEDRHYSDFTDEDRKILEGD
ncbi:MAG: stage 0 sporulation family protein [Candidatus Kapaibacterium sp.]